MRVRLANPEHQLPWPGVPGRIVIGDEVFEINPAQPFWGACLRDGSIIVAPLAPEPDSDGSLRTTPDRSPDARPLAGEPGPAAVKGAKPSA
jgi:hypothetical protein